MKRIVLWHGAFTKSYVHIIDNNFYQFFLNALCNRYGWVPEFRDVKNACPDSNSINIMVFPCENIDVLVNDISKIDAHTLIWCKTNGVKIIFSFARECACEGMLDRIFNAIKNHPLMKDYISIIRILINSYSKHLKKYNNLFININSFDFIYRDYVEILRLKRIILEKQYKFSLFTGTLCHRKHRAQFLLDLKAQNQINDWLFYTVMQPEHSSMLNSYLKENFSLEEIKILNTLKLNTCVDESGNNMLSSKIYSSLQEWHIPKQMMQSCVNIVLETCLNCPAITEKIYKPILAGVPFIWLGHPHIATELQNQGYKLYPFINYDFDAIDDANKRREAVVAEVNRLSFLNLQDKIVENEQTINYNIDKFFVNTSLHRLDHFIKQL